MTPNTLRGATNVWTHSRTSVHSRHRGVRSVRAWFIATMLMGLPALLTRAGTCTADMANTKQTIRGFGAATLTWQGALTSSDMDKGFTSGAGSIGLTIARMELPPASSGWAAEVANGAAAKSRGAIVMATPWSPPAAMKTNNNTVGGSLKTSEYGNYASHLQNFVTYCNNNGSSLYAVSVQNEPDWDPDYVSCTWTASQLQTFCRNNMGIFSATKVIMPESLRFNKAYSDPTLNDSAAAANIDIVGGHIYGGGIAAYSLATSKGKELWMTEHLDTNTLISAVIGTAKEIHDCLNVGQYHAYVWWYLKRAYGPLDTNGNRSKRGCVMAQFARWVRPGYVRVACTNNPSTNIYVTAYKGSKAVVVAVNVGTSSVSQTFSILNRTVGSVTPYRTSATQDLATLSSITLSNGSFTTSLPAQSVTTFVQN